VTAASQRELRRRQRAAARAHHPDLGGDPAELVRAWQRLDQAGDASVQKAHTVASPPPASERRAGPEVVFVTRPSRLARWVRWHPLRRRARRPAG
jgi:hypothetical protein